MRGGLALVPVCRRRYLFFGPVNLKAVVVAVVGVPDESAAARLWCLFAAAVWLPLLVEKVPFPVPVEAAWLRLVLRQWLSQRSLKLAGA